MDYSDHFECGARIGVLFLTILWLASAQLHGAPPVVAISKERLVAEGGVGWQRLERSTHLPAGSVTTVTIVHVTQPSDPDYRKDYYRKDVREFWLGQGTAKSIVTSYNSAGGWLGCTAYCMNPHYAFTAKQPSSDAPYFVTRYGSDTETVDQVQSSVELATAWAKASFYALPEGCRLLDLFASADCTFLGCHLVSDNTNASQLAEVEYTFRPSMRAAQWDPSLRRCTMLLEPNVSWRVVRKKVVSDRLNQETQITYNPDDPSGAEVSRIVVRTMQPGGRIAEDVHDIKLIFDPIVPNSEYYLPAFGLPEIQTEHSKRSWRLAIIGCNVLLVGAILYLVCYLKRPRGRRGEAA